MPAHPLPALLALALLSLPSRISAHGFVSWPRQRGLLPGNGMSNLKPIDTSAPHDYCPHCLSGGGKGEIAGRIPNGLWTPYEPTNPNFPFRADHGICGDPFGSTAHMAPSGKFFAGKTLATYEEEDFIDIETYISAHHNGFFEFFVCSLDCCAEPDISQRCFQKKGCCHKLMRVPHTSCESGYDRICGPVERKHPGRWYLPPRNQTDPTFNWFGGLNKKMRYALPKGLVCEKCVIHWSWTTANSCNPPGYAAYNFPQKWAGIEGDGGATGGINRVFGTCGDSKPNFPEEFWSCAENVRIVRKNGGKSRTQQIFHNGDMNIEGPSDTTSSQHLKPYKEPVSASGQQEPSPESSSNASPTPESSLGASPTPESSLGANPPPGHVDEAGMPVVTPPAKNHSGNGTVSKYDLSAYITSFDTGICVKSRDNRSYCEACLNLGYGVTKCMWCHVSADRKETCLHMKP